MRWRPAILREVGERSFEIVGYGLGVWAEQYRRQAWWRRLQLGLWADGPRWALIRASRDRDRPDIAPVRELMPDAVHGTEAAGGRPFLPLRPSISGRADKQRVRPWPGRRAVTAGASRVANALVGLALVRAGAAARSTIAGVGAYKAVPRILAASREIGRVQCSLTW